MMGTIKMEIACIDTRRDAEHAENYAKIAYDYACHYAKIAAETRTPSARRDAKRAEKLATDAARYAAVAKIAAYAAKTAVELEGENVR